MPRTGQQTGVGNPDGRQPGMLGRRSGATAKCDWRQRERPERAGGPPPTFADRRADLLPCQPSLTGPSSSERTRPTRPLSTLPAEFLIFGTCAPYPPARALAANSPEPCRAPDRGRKGHRVRRISNGGNTVPCARPVACPIPALST